MEDNIILRPVSHRVLYVNLDKTETHKNKFSLNYQIVFDKNIPKQFAVIFLLELEKAGAYSLNVRYETKFDSNKEIDKNFLNGDFAKINAPAIAFPFLRSFISFLILTAGYKPLILQSVNFTKFNKEEIKIIYQGNN